MLAKSTAGERRGRAGRWPRNGRRTRSDQDLHRELFVTSEHVLLCCFGSAQAPVPRSAETLHRALVDAGFRATEARHLVRTSTLLSPTAAGHYVMRQFDDASAQS